MLVENINDKILYDLRGLKKCPKMFLRGDITYTSVETYLNAYFRGVEHGLGVKLEDKIKHWFEERVNQKSSCFFTAYVACCYKDKSDEERIHILLDLTEIFFHENPRWYR